MKYYYAHINKDNICIGVIATPSKLNKDYLIQINEYDIGLCNKKYNNGEWEEVPQPEPEPTQLDKIEEQVYSNNDSNLIIMEAMADQYEQTEQYRLNDMEVQATIFESVLALSEGGTTV